MSETKTQTLEIQLDEQVAQGSYCNRAIITHSPSEFIIDFAAVLPGITKVRVKNRIVLTPEHAKRLLLTLQENISRYEATMGQIKLPSIPSPIDPFGNKGRA
ncbi:MAG: DUF3467 domain-containing protein [Alistipes sp.]|nr:DUF3467 domain-containing protein [Alistipes sp.]